MTPAKKSQDHLQVDDGISPLGAIAEIRRYLEDLYLYEGRQFILPEINKAPAVPTANETAFAVTASPLAAGDDIELFRQQICECQQCPLGATRTNFVFGTGNPDADLLFLGEAPGRDEDLQGEPFVGAAGQLLTKIIEAMELRRENVYICNVLKCRPPKNRDPEPDEVDACEPHLQRQIELVRPKLICVLGRIAAQTLLRTNSSLSRLRGELHEYQGIPVIVTYHPAALLRDASYKRSTWEDVKWVRRELDGVEIGASQ